MRDAVEEVRSRIAELRALARARIVAVIDGAGQFVASDGDSADLDTTALAQRADEQLKDVSATLLRQRGCDVYDERTNTNMHCRSVGRRLILIVIYGSESATGLVQLGVERAVGDLGPWVRFETRFHEIPEDDDEDDG